MSGNIIFENDCFKLEIGEDCVAESLVCKASGEECLGGRMPIFSLTEPRPFNNEVKLAYPNKTITFQAERVRREGSRLIVGFEIVGFEAVIDVEVKPKYMTFKLVEFIGIEEWFKGLDMTPPPVTSFRLLQLPIKHKERFGQWLNVLWDDKTAVNVLANAPETIIDSEKREDYRVLYAESRDNIKLYETGAVLAVCPPDELLDVIDDVEKDYDLPRGVESRRSKDVRCSIYFAGDISPENVDKHIEYAKKGGYTKMTIYTAYLIDEDNLYSKYGDYKYGEKFKNAEGLKGVLDKIKAAGISPGFHILHTHIGIKTSYVTPVPDHRLNLARHFTLARDVKPEDSVIYVEENPAGTIMHEKCRVLRFGKELIYYDGYSTEVPYCFTGCKRGHWGTGVFAHEMGLIGGILDVSEYGGTSVYVDQNTSLQDEVGKKLADMYNLGFEYVYFDGSEGTNRPYEYYVPYAQYRVYKMLDKKPSFCEGAAKAHFSWHMLSGSNAFDVFPTDKFKKSIIEYPADEAPRMANDFTRVNFGWWSTYKDTQPDTYEYGASKAVAWNCPHTVQAFFEPISENPRMDDAFEVVRRWEDISLNGLLTDAQKEQLKDPDTEYTALINEEGEYEIVPYELIREGEIRAFYFERRNKNYVVYWSTSEEDALVLDLKMEDIYLEDELGGKAVELIKTEGGVEIPASKKRYLSTELPKEKIVEAFKKAVIK